eukprot:scaffold4518_cov410-Prasinococcus_capsulatus_cf.AAC.31
MPTLLYPAVPTCHRLSAGMKLTTARKCCDCTHWCYSPVLWDAALIAPVTDILTRDGYHFDILPKRPPPDAVGIFPQYPSEKPHASKATRPSVKPLRPRGRTCVRVAGPGTDP